VAATVSFPREKIRVVLCEGIHPSAVDYLAEHGYTQVESLPRAPSPPELRALVKDAHIVGIRSRTVLDKEALSAGPRIMAVGCFCIGTDQVDGEFAAERGIPVFNAPHANTRSVAELVIGLSIMLERDAFRKSGLVHAGQWPKSAAGAREVRGKTIGIVGYGHIGSQVSVLAEGLGMRVLFHDIVRKLPLGNAESVGTLDELLKASDIVTLHVPQTAATTNMMDAARIGAMRKGAFLINTSRGVVVDQGALAAALRAGHVAGAAVDVFPREPLSADAPLESPLRGIPNVILTPHVAGSTEEAQEKIGTEVAGKLVAYSDHGSTDGAVNFPGLTLAPHDRANRLLHIHENVPGMLQRINSTIAGEGINVLAQRLETRKSVGYVVFDIEKKASEALLERLKAIPGTIRTRILY
jgi:D-3-phosphoglycerate dehydrogenase